MRYFSKRIFFFALLFGIIFGVFSSVSLRNSNENTAAQEKNRVTVSFKQVSVEAEVADREDTRTLGLSGRDQLEEGEGMWFVFPSDDHHSFWMKDMNFPIDILWFDKDLKVVSIKENAMPESYPNSFTPSSFDRYVLEVPSGFAKKYEVSFGDTISVHKTP